MPVYRQIRIETPVFENGISSAVDSLTPNFRGESHDKGFPEDADTNASGGGLYHSEAF